MDSPQVGRNFRSNLCARANEDSALCDNTHEIDSPYSDKDNLLKPDLGIEERSQPLSQEVANADWTIFLILENQMMPRSIRKFPISAMTTPSAPDSGKA